MGPMLSNANESGQEVVNDSTKSDNDDLNICMIGNSILYYNDCPRLLQAAFRASVEKSPELFRDMHQDSCLRGGASLMSILTAGNGMKDKFVSDIGAASVRDLLQGSSVCWQYVIMNDYTQGPAREPHRKSAINALKKSYVPMLLSNGNCIPVVILLQTAAYRVAGINGSADLGDFKQFTRRIRQGYDSYASALQQEIKKRLQAANGRRTIEYTYAVVAPVGDAFAKVREQHSELFDKLYAPDDFHFSPSGTWLEACVLYATIMRHYCHFHWSESSQDESNYLCEPPLFSTSFFDHARYRQPSEQALCPFPTAEEAETLRKIAILVVRNEIARK
jgi:hypothetical protein